MPPKLFSLNQLHWHILCVVLQLRVTFGAAGCENVFMCCKRMALIMSAFNKIGNYSASFKRFCGSLCGSEEEKQYKVHLE